MQIGKWAFATLGLIDAAQISHESPFLCGYHGIFLRRPMPRTGKDCVSWRRAALEKTRVHGASPRRNKGVLAGGHEDYSIKACRASPGRTQVAWCNAKEDQGRVGRHPEGLRARLVAPGRMIYIIKGASEGSHWSTLHKVPTCILWVLKQFFYEVVHVLAVFFSHLQNLFSILSFQIFINTCLDVQLCLN